MWAAGTDRRRPHFVRQSELGLRSRGETRQEAPGPGRPHVHLGRQRVARVSQNEPVHPQFESRPSPDENPESQQTLEHKHWSAIPAGFRSHGKH